MAANIALSITNPRNRRLSGRASALWLTFDMVQLAVLLSLTGGLHNPNALLLLAPVTVSASALRTMTTAVLGALAIAIITVLAFWNLPILTATGIPIRLPGLVLFGFWVALVTGVVFLSIYARQVTREIREMSDALVATQMALAREQKLTDMGGVVAAAAHELGTPLATIKLVSSELLDEVTDTDLRDDIRLIGAQTDRCRDILRAMGETGKDDLYLRRAPFEAVVKAAAEPHVERGKRVGFQTRHADGADARQPEIFRQPEILHGLRNLIQNAVDFAKGQVRIEMTWSDTAICVRISDDGMGFPASIIGRIGDPFMRRRRAGDDSIRRPGYDGMGLGLFIAKTLLERTGASVGFANDTGVRDLGGAIVTVDWPRAEIEAKGALGENRPHVDTQGGVAMSQT